MTNINIKNLLSFKTATGRWSAVGPYYAMFPRNFAFEVVEEYSKRGDLVLDPFAGRASSIYAAVATGRRGCGIEINPVGWLYGYVKLKPALKTNVERRIKTIGKLAHSVNQKQLNELPEFFSICYCRNVLRYLICARSILNWKTSRIDRTLMAIILIHLHGKRENSLSNQMRQGKSMAPDYSIRWWKERNLQPPDIYPVEFLIRRIEWRYAKGIPNYLDKGTIILGDSTLILKNTMRSRYKIFSDKFHLLFTSPPYYRMTNYHYDQWLRLWMLGGPSRPLWISQKWQNRFESKVAYEELLINVFTNCTEILDDSAILYIRTDAREFTYQTTLKVLKTIFPTKFLKQEERPFSKETQTALFGDKSKKPGEIDIIMYP
jgi:DNA modification methylase